MALATLSIDIVAELSKFEAQLEKAARVAEKNADATRAAWSKAGATLTGLAAGAAGLLAGYSFVDAVRQNIDFLDSLNDMQDATGASIEKLSGLVDLAERTGTSADVAETAVVKLNAALNDADPNSGTSRALKAIGLSVQELKALDPVDALQKVAKALAGYADDGNKARLVQELLGKSARELAPLLKDLGEAGTLQSKVTAEQAAEAEKFNKQLAALRTNSAEVGRTLTSELLPALNGILTTYSKFGGLKGVLATAFGLDDLSQQTKALELLNADVTRAADNVARLQEGVSRDPGNDKLQAYLTRAKARLDVLRAQAAAASEALKISADAVDGGKGRGDYSNEGRNYEKRSVGDVAAKQVTPKKESIDESSRALAAYVEQLQRQVEATYDLTEQQKALDVLKSLGSTGEIDQVREVVLGLADKLQKLKDEEEIEKGITAELKRQADAQKALDDQLDAFSGRTADALKRAQTARLEARLAAGEVFTPEELDRIVKGIAGIGDQSKDSFDEMGEFAKQAARNIQDTLGSSVQDLLEGNYSSIEKSWASMLNRMVAQAIAADLGKSLLGDFDKTGQLGGWLGELLGTSGGTASKSSTTSSGGSSGGIIGALASQLLGSSGSGGSAMGSVWDLFGSSWGGGFWANGGAFDAFGPVKAFAAGDVFDSPTAFRYGTSQLGIMGEAGPEGVLPLRRDAFGRLGVMAGGGGGGSSSTTHQYIQVSMPEGANRSTGLQFGRTIASRLAVANQRNG